MYRYEVMRPALFTDEGQRTLLRVRDHTVSLLEMAGAVRMDHAMMGANGDSWLLVACVERLVELGELREVKQPAEVATQHRVFVGVAR